MTRRRAGVSVGSEVSSSPASSSPSLAPPVPSPSWLSSDDASAALSRARPRFVGRLEDAGVAAASAAAAAAAAAAARTVR